VRLGKTNEKGHVANQERAMPIIKIHMGEGRTIKQKRTLIAGVTDAVIAALGVRGEQVRILIEELAPEHFAVAGKTTGEKHSNAETPVQRRPLKLSTKTEEQDRP
jgi:4-oxalocrotonate tautomerase